jgi:hypothetical protein
MKIRFYPLALMLFIWHLKCFYELAIISPLWFIWPLPTNPENRVERIICIYILIAINIIYQLWAGNNEKYNWAAPIIILLSSLFFPLLAMSFGHN